MLLAELVEVSRAVGSTRSRLEKRRLLAELLGRVPEEELEIAAAWLSGTLLQRRTGVGWRGLAELPPPAAEPTADLTGVDEALAELAALAGSGSGGRRREAVNALFGSLTATEQAFLRDLMTGQVRQGALDSVMIDAVAQAADLPQSRVRAAAMYSAATGPVARAALYGGPEALDGFTLQVGRPVRPMLAAGAADVAAGLTGVAPDGAEVAVDTKLDGVRIQVHRDGEDVQVFTRSLEEVAARMPGVVRVVRGLPAERLVLDGEAMLVDDSGRPLPFQETSSAAASAEAEAELRPFFFDVLHDGEPLVDRPTSERLEALDRLVPAEHRVRRLVTADPDAAADFFAGAVRDGQEGVVLKRLDAPYAAGRRGSAWVKVKPRHTLDLVVLAVEWGSGRRRGLLSNIHLGARDPQGDGFVMVGKTFKGMTDQMLAWQTERFLGLETHREGHVVHVRPEQVVEIALDGVQRSTRYAGGAALRFARVVRYRDDKTVEEVDTIDSVRTLAGG